MVIGLTRNTENALLLASRCMDCRRHVLVLKVITPKTLNPDVAPYVIGTLNQNTRYGRIATELLNAIPPHMLPLLAAAETPIYAEKKDGNALLSRDGLFLSAAGEGSEAQVTRLLQSCLVFTLMHGAYHLNKPVSAEDSNALSKAWGGVNLRKLYKDVTDAYHQGLAMAFSGTIH